MLKKNFFQ